MSTKRPDRFERAIEEEGYLQGIKLYQKKAAAYILRRHYHEMRRVVQKERLRSPIGSERARAYDRGIVAALAALDRWRKG